MAVTFSITRTTTRFHDSNGNGLLDAGELNFDFDEAGVYDPGDILYTRIRITNNGNEPATGVTLEDATTGTSPLVNPADANDLTWINISPIASNDTYEAVANTVLRVGTNNTINGGESTFVTGSLTSNDVGSLAGDDVPGFTIDAVSGTTAKGGTYNIYSNGTFNYVNDGNDTDIELAAGDSFTYTIRDVGMDGLTNTADDLTSTATVTITFAQQSPGVVHRVWYVDGNAVTNGTGTSTSPFQSSQIATKLNGGGDVDAAGHYIYVENSVAGPLTLEASQLLIGTGSALTVGGYTIAGAGTNSSISATGANFAVTLGSGNTVRGIDIEGTGHGLTGLNFGTVTVDDVTINVSGGAIYLNNGAFAGTGFDSIGVVGSPGNAVNFSDVTGTVALGTGQINATGTEPALAVVNSTASPNGLNVTFGGTINSSINEAAVQVTGGTGGHTGTVTLTGSITATNGTGLQFTNADGTYNLTGAISLTGTADAGIDITAGSNGTFTFGSAGNQAVVTNNSGGDAFVVTASNANVTFNGAITDNNGNAVNIDGHDGGTITFQNGSISSTGSGIDVINSNGGAINFNSQVNLSTGANTGIILTNNSGSATNFNPTGTGLDVTTTSGSGILANNAGTITIADTGTGNTIAVSAAAGGAVAFSATGGTTIGAAGVTFDSINQNGGTNAIVLNGTGTAGGFNILGNGATGTSGEGTGGTIQNTSGDAIVLSNAAGVKLNDMIIGANAATAGEGQPDTTVNIGDDGISMTSVVALAGQNYGLVLDNVTISRTGGHGINGTGGGNVGLKIVDSRFLNVGNDLAGTTESAIDFGTGFATSSDQLVGTVYIDRTTFAGFTGYGFTVENAGNGTLNMTVDNSVFKNNDATGIGDSGIQIIADGSNSANNPKVNLLVEDTTFTNIDLDGIEIFADPGSTFNATIRRTTHSSPTGDNAIHVASGSRDSDDTESMTVLLEDNNVTAMRGSLIFLKSGAGTFDATVTGGTLDSGDTDNGASGHIGRGIELLVDSDHDPSQSITGDVTHTRLKVDNVTIRNIGVDGIHVGMNEIQSGSTISVSITNSSIGSATAPVGRSDTGEGIEIIAHDATMNLLISGNTIFTRGISGTSEAIDVDSQTQNFTATVNATITNNHLNNINLGGAPAANNLDVNAETAASTVNLDLSGNFSDNGPIDPDYQLANSGVFTLKGPGVGAATAASVQAQQASGTASVSGAVVYNNNAAIAQPTAPGTPTLPPAPPANLSAEAPAPEEVTEEKFVDTPKVDNSDGDAPAAVGPVVVDDGVLSQAELDLIVDAAITRWAAAGATADQVAAMRAVSVSVADLGGLTLGESNVGTIVLDSDAAGWRWFVDATPGDDSEYAGTGTRLAAIDKLGMAGTRIDLLTVLTHELGHQIGLSDSYYGGDVDELMYGTIGAGERRLPGADDLSYAADGPVTGAYAFAQMSLGTIPAGQTVIVEYRQTIDNPGEDRLVGSWTGQAFIDSDQMALSQSSNAESGNIDALLLTGLIYNDVNKNGVFDAGDTGVAGVTLTLYADSNNSGAFDAGDLYVGYTDNNGVAGYQQGVDTPAAPGNGTPLTATTDANGIYTFANLAPGDYIVRVNASNFGAGVLGNKVSHGNPANPNDINSDADSNPATTPADVNVDNDNNGEQFLIGQAGTYAASRAIRLDYGQETDAGPTGPALDTNDTLDLGFDQPNQPPAGANATIAINEDATRTLTDADFPITDPEGNTLLEVVINSVSGGKLTVGGTDVSTYPTTVTLTQLQNNAVVFTPTQHLNGTGAASISFQVRDNGGTANGGVNTDQSANTLTFNIAAVNDPVGASAPETETVFEDTPKAINGLAISDADAALAPNGVYVVTLSSTNGTMSVTTNAGLTFSAGDGTADATMTFRGTLSAINTALATAVYAPASNYGGPAEIQLQATDQFGATVATGTGAGTNASDTTAVTVTAVNDAPTNTVGGAVATSEDAAAVALTGMTVDDVEATGDVSYTLSVEHGTLDISTDVSGGIEASDIQAVPGTGDGTSTIVITATIAQIKATLAAANGLTYTPTQHYNGVDTLTAYLNDLGQTGTDPGGPAIDPSLAATTEEDLDTRTINIAAVNDAPVVPNSPAVNATEQTPVTLNSSLTISDVDLDARNGGNGDYGGASFVVNRSGGSPDDSYGFDTAGALFTVVGNALQSGGQTFATFSIDTTDGILSISFTSSGTAATTALVNDVVRHIQYTNLSNNPPASVELLYGLDDGAPGGGQGTVTASNNFDGGQVTVNLTAVNDNPTITNLQGDDVAFVEGSTPQYSDAGGNAAVTDPDSANFDGGTLTVDITANEVAAEDVLAPGTDADFTLDGTAIKYQGTTVATFAGGTNGVALVITFNANATPAIVSTVTTLVNYDNVNEVNPSTAQRTLTWTLTDGDGGSTSVTSTMTVIGVNDAPTAANKTVATSEDDAYSFTAADFGFQDGDGHSLESIKITELPATGELRLNDVAVTDDQVIAAADIANLKFHPVVDQVGSPYATFKFTVTDTGDTANGGADTSGEYTMTINVTPDNFAPTFALDDTGPSATLAYTENQPASIIAPDAQLSDSDSANFDTGKLTVKFDANGEATDQLGIANQGTGAGQISVSGNEVKYENVTIGTFSGGTNGTNLVVDFNSSATPAAAQALVRAITYHSTSQNPGTGSRTVNFAVSDGDGGTSQANAAVNITILNDAPVNGVPGTQNATEDTDKVFSSGTGNAITVSDDDAGSGDMTVTLSVSSGRLTLASTAGLSSFSNDGTATVTLSGSQAAINTALDGLRYRGNLNFQGPDTLTILTSDNGLTGDGGTKTDTDQVAINVADDGFIDGDSGNNVLTGTPQVDFFRVHQGGNDSVSGLASRDVFYFGAAFAPGDTVNGGGNADIVILQGNYSAGVSLAGITNLGVLGSISLFSGTNTAYGDTSDARYDYNLTAVEGNVDAGSILKINGSSLLIGEDLTFNGSAESNGSFFVYGGRGTDTLTGGGLGDYFIFGHLGQFGSGDSVNGGGGYDVVFLRGDYNIDLNGAGFGASTFVGVESIGLLSASDTTYASGGDGEFDYSITWNNALMASGQMTINGGRLGENESLSFNGSSETNGTFRLFGGAGQDGLTGGTGNDLIFGGGNGDILTGGGGNDIFRYQSTEDSRTTGHRDGIQDFSAGDLIDLQRIDADINTDGDQAFQFIGANTFTNTAGQLRAVKADGVPQWTVEADVDGDGNADMTFIVVTADSDPITAIDFLV